MSLFTRPQMLWLILSLCAGSMVLGQDSATISAELIRMGEADQQGRLDIREIAAQHGELSPQWQQAWDAQHAIDATHMQRLEQIIEQAGWPRRSEVGEEAATAAFLILQHADAASQQKYLPLLRDAVAAREARPGNYAMLYDRVLMGKGEKQLYGTQLKLDEETAIWYVWPIKDEAEVNERRGRLGMNTIEESLKGFPRALGPVPQQVADSFTEDLDNSP